MLLGYYNFINPTIDTNNFKIFNSVFQLQINISSDNLLL